MRLLKGLLPKWHIDTVVASTSNAISHKMEWDWVGSLGGGCTKQNHGGVGSLFFSDQGTLAKVECQSSSIFVSWFCLFHIQTLWQPVSYKKSRSRKDPSASLHELDMWGNERRESAVWVSHSVLQSASSAQRVFEYRDITDYFSKGRVFSLFVHCFENIEKKS